MNIEIRPSRYDATKVDVRLRYDENASHVVTLTPEELFELAAAIDDYIETEEFMAIYRFYSEKRMRKDQ